MDPVRYRQNDVLLLLLSVAILMLSWPSQSVAQEQTTMSGIQLRPGVIIDPDRRLAYVMSPEGGTLAVALADGREIWSTMEIAKPLVLVGNLLVGQAPPSDGGNELRIVVLNAEERGRRVAGESVDLPAGVQVSIDDTLGTSFVADARPLAGDAVISWRYSERAVQGMPPEQEIRGMPPAEEIRGEQTTDGRAAAELESGAFRLDLPSGAISPMPPQEAMAVPARRAAELAVAAPLPGVPGPQILSADGRHVVSSERVANDSVWEKYLWTIYDRSTAQAIGEFRTFQSLAPFFVSDSEVIYETPPYARQVQGNLIQEPLKIRAVDLSTGQEIWSREVRDPTYRGPLPP